ncbi:MAG TPA: L,D-transpeptidase [bacterium]|jgi:hypothetical protein
MDKYKWLLLIATVVFSVALVLLVPNFKAMAESDSTDEASKPPPASSENTSTDETSDPEDLIVSDDYTVNPYGTLDLDNSPTDSLELPVGVEHDFLVKINEDLPPVKHILISLTDQEMWVFEDDEIVQNFLVSTGVPGHRTPVGHYKVRNQALSAYSQRYDAVMLSWMAISLDGLYGMHALQGTSYLRHLGSVASHGCIRLSHEDAEWLYDWVDIGTEVEIVADWEEPAEKVESEIKFEIYPFL